jgi:Dna[CI] antecedent, DciA
MLESESRSGIVAGEFILERVSRDLEKVVVSAVHRGPRDEAPLTVWPLACGSVVAERTRAIKFCDGALSVEVPDAEWKRQMCELAPRYLAALNRYAGQKVQRIEFVIRPA